MSVVDKYFEAVGTGRIGEVESFLNTADEIDLDVNMTDTNGHNAYVVAINEGFDVIVKLLLRFRVNVGDALLYAVENNAVDSVKLLCTYATTLPERECLEIIDCRCSTDEFPKITTPIIQAALNNNFAIVKILVEYGVRVPDPEVDLEHFTAPPETLERSKEMLTIYRALTSDAYMSECSINPIQTAFDLTDKMRGLSGKLEEFKAEFNELACRVEEYAAKLLHQCRDMEEILTVLTFTEGQTIEPEISELSMVEYAIACDQKNFIAHPNCQKVVINQYYRHLISLREKSTLRQILTQLFVMIAFPFLSIAFLVYPAKHLVRLLQVPYIKFYMSIGSEIFFLALLIYDSVSDSREGTAFIATQIVITFWIIGKTWAEIECMTSKYEDFFGRNLMTSLYNFLILVLLFIVFMLRFVVYLQDIDDGSMNKIQKRALDEVSTLESVFLTQSIPNFKDHILLSLNETENSVNSNLEDNLDTFVVDLMKSLTCTTTMQTTPEPSCTGSTRLNLDSINPSLIIESVYAFAIVLIVLRLSSIAVINEYVGPLQISLGGMAVDIAVFGGIFCIVWLAFSIGMNQLHSSFQEIEYETCVNSMADDCKRGEFSSILESLITFYWVLLGNVAFKTAFVGTGRFYFTEWVSILFFALYIIVAVLILLNALIAMMSNTYCAVEENADIEWKFSRTASWMTYMNSCILIPPPFNIFPWQWNICKKSQTGDSVNTNKKSENEEYLKRKFQKTIAKLVERFVHETTADENSVGGGLSKRDIQSLKSDVISFRYECGKMLDVLYREMDNTTKQTVVTRDKLDIAKEIRTNAEGIQIKLLEHRATFSDVHTDLLALRDHSVRRVPPPPQPPKNKPMKRQTSSRVSMMSGLFNQASVSGGLSEEAKEIFK